MKKIKQFLKYAITALAFLIFSSNSYAQLFQTYKQYSNHINYPYKIMEDVFGDVIILTGEDITYPFGGAHWNVAKYGPNGNFLWDYTYAAIGSAYYAGADMALDGSGNIFVTSKFDSIGSGFTDIHTVKLSGAGNVMWAHYYNPIGSIVESPKITFDPSGNNIAIGCALGTGVLIMKYDNIGNLLFDQYVYLTPTGNPDLFIASDPAGNSYVAVSAIHLPTYSARIIRIENTGYIGYDSALYAPSILGATFKGFEYSYANNELLFSLAKGNDVFCGEISLGSGDPLWDEHFPNAATSCFRSDASGNSYINITQNGVYKIFKYNGAGNLVWDIITTYTPWYTAFEVDNNGNVYNRSGNVNGHTIDKISGGSLLWSYNLNISTWPVNDYPLTVGFATNNYLVYAFHDVSGQGVIRYNQCSILTCNINPTVTITNITNAACDNGKIKVNLFGTFQVAPHIRLYNAANTLINSITLPLGTLNYTFLNLSPGAYTVKVYDAAYDCCEEILSANVKCAAPSAGFTTTNITSAGAKVNWDVSNCGIGYRVQYRVQGTSTWTTKTVSTNTGYKTLTGLLPLTIYEWRINTNCSGFATAIYSAYSAIQTFTTLCACSQPTNIIVTNITQTSAKVNWTGNACAYQYRLQYRKQGVTTWTTKYILAPTLFKTITGLLANSIYEYRLRTDCDVSGTPNSGYTTIQTFTTATLRIQDESVSSNTETEQFEINIKPNPVSNMLALNFHSENSTAQIRIVNTLGEIVFAKQFSSEDGNYVKQLNVSGLRKGMYVLIVQTENGVNQKRFVKE